MKNKQAKKKIKEKKTKEKNPTISTMTMTTTSTVTMTMTMTRLVVGFAPSGFESCHKRVISAKAEEALQERIFRLLGIYGLRIMMKKSNVLLIDIHYFYKWF